MSVGPTSPPKLMFAGLSQENEGQRPTWDQRSRTPTAPLVDSLFLSCRPIMNDIQDVSPALRVPRVEAELELTMIP